MSEARLQEALLALAASERRERALRASSEALLLGVEMLEEADTTEELERAIRGAFLRAIPATECFVLHGQNGVLASPAGELVLPDGELVARARKRGVINLYDFQRTTEATRTQGADRFRAMLLVPLEWFGNTGLVVLVHGKRGAFSAEHARTAGRLRRFAEIAAGRLARLARAREMALDAQLARLERLLDLVPAGVFLVDHQGAPKLANREARRLFDPLDGWRALRAHLAAQEHGPLRVALGTRSVAIAARATAEGWVGVARDLTDIERWRRRIEHTERLASLVRMAGGIAHDFNNQLMAVLGGLQLLREMLGEEQEEARELLALVEEATRTMARLSRRMLLFTGVAHASTRRVDLARLARKIVEQAQDALAPGVALRLTHAGEAVAAADADQVTEAATALLDNAVEAVAEHGGEVRIATGEMQADAQMLEAAPVRAEDAAPGRYVFIEVTDDGRGIAEENLEHIFEPFFSTKFAGRGLGLAVVLGVARAFGGFVQVENRPGKGARFRLCLPRQTS